MTDKTCGNCVFWGKPGETEMFRQCNGVIHIELEAVNANENEPPPYRPRWRERVGYVNSLSAVVVDGSGCFAALKTKEDFGCTLFREAGE